MKRVVAAGIFVALLTMAGAASAASPGDISAAQLPVIQAVNADPANFGGVYIDSDGTLVIQYVGANAGRAAVDKVIGVGVAVRWVKVERSETELDRILRDIQARQLEGVSMIAVDTINNRVDVYVHAPATTDAVSAALGGTYADEVQVASGGIVQTAACNTVLNCTRWRGALYIERHNGTAACTWGYNASQNGLLIMVTAGHCHTAGGKFDHNGVTIGTNGVIKNAMKPATFEGADVESTWVNGTYWPTSTSPGQNVVYVNDSFKSWSLTSVRAQGAYAVNQLAAKAGWRTAYTTGYIVYTSIEWQLVPAPGESLIYYPSCTNTQTATCPWVSGMASTTHIDAGDSGAPVFDWAPVSPSMGHVFLGIISSSGILQGGTEVSLWTPGYQAAAALDLEVWCTTAGCP